MSSSETRIGKAPEYQDSTILIIDDEPANLGVMVETMTHYGFRTAVARTGGTGVDMACRDLPDMILLDINLPDIDGYEVCRRLKADQRTRDIPVIFLSVMDGILDRIRGFELGAVDYIAKPFQHQEALARITTHLRVRTLTEQLEQTVLRRTAELMSANEQLKHSEQRYAMAQRAGNIGSWDWDIANNVLEWSETIEPMFGFSRGQFGGTYEAFLQCIHPADHETVVEAVNASINENHQYVVEHRIVWPDKTVRWVFATGDVFRDENGKAVRMLGIVQDITQRKQTEEKLRQSEERYRSIFNNAVEGIYQATPGAIGRFINANPAHARILGYDSPEQMVAEITEIGPTFWIDPQERKDFSERVAREPVTNFEVQLRRRDNSLVWVSLNAWPVFDGFGELDYIEGIMLDITSRKREENKLEEYRQRLEALVEERTAELTTAKEGAEAANAAKSEFLARMSHEIRTPLNVVTGLTNIVLKSDLSTEQRDYLSKVQIASNNLMEVINDILDFSKVEAGRLELAHSPFDLHRVLEQLSDLFSNRAAKKDIEIIFAVDPLVPRQLTGDAGRLTQVLTNLLENAVKFTEAGEIVLRVGLDEGAGLKPGQAIIKFQVIDTGTGIASDMLPTLFDPFTQADGYLTRKHEGAGLGLAICRRLVELMGGQIWVESIPGQGSTFSFTVRLIAQQQEMVELPVPEDLHGLKVLVVDDSESARQVLTDMLESFTFNAESVDSGEEAVELLDREPTADSFKLMLLNWRLPGMDGIETARRIRALGHRKSQIPIIILVTAYGRDLVQAQMGKAMADTLLLKPVNSSQLLDIIIELLGHAEAAVPKIKTKEAADLSRLTDRRVLVVEDSELNRVVAVALLEEAGLLVDIAQNGRIAVDMVTGSVGGYYDAILMDIQMPVVDGYQATSKIREFEKQRNTTFEQPGTRTPIIALTAHALKGEKEKCLAAGMDDYLAKPLDEQDLHQVLLKWIVSDHTA